MKFLILFIYLITVSASYSIERPNIKNIIVIKDPKTYQNIIFKDNKNLEINLKDYKGKLIIINFWATWCAPCREEMPSLDLLQSNRDLYNLKIFPINVGQENLAKSEKFFQKLRIKNLNIYYDDSKNLSKKFALRGIPTSIILNKRGEEFARILGTINFEDEEFINWLKKFN